MNYLRTKVSGRKKRLVEDKYNLDLSYITTRLIAMAFPASNLEKFYRNDINSVSEYLKLKHKDNFLVINLSSRKYDYSKFNNQVLEYNWVDHHAPPINILFTICVEINNFLIERDENVVAINCLAGKGRTGTIICCFLMFVGRFTTADQALEYYSKKRFSKGDGVTQPSQKRYVYYFERLLKEKIYFPYTLQITDICINKIPLNSTSIIKPFVEIYLNNGSRLSQTSKLSYSEQKKIFSNGVSFVSLIDSDFNLSFCGDITIKIYNNEMLSIKNICRTAINSAFLDENTDSFVFKLNELDPDKLVKNKLYPNDFELHIKVKRLCCCSNKDRSIPSCSKCINYNQKELHDWKMIHSIIEGLHLNKKVATFILFGNDEEEDDVEEVMKTNYPIISDQELNIEEEMCKSEPSSLLSTKKLKITNEDLNNSLDGECIII